MTKRQLHNLLQQLEQDPLLPLSLEQSEELQKLAAHNSKVAKVLRFVQEQQETDQLLREKFRLLKAELAKIPLPPLPSSEQILFNANKSLLWYTLPLVALLVLAITIFFLWQPPLSETSITSGMSAMPEAPTHLEKEAQTSERSKTTMAKTQQSAVSKKPIPLVAKKSTSPDSTSKVEDSKFSASVMNMPRVATQTPRSEETLQKPTPEETLKLRQRVNLLWLQVKQNPKNEKAKKELRSLLEKLGDQQGLTELSKY